MNLVLLTVWTHLGAGWLTALQNSWSGADQTQDEQEREAAKRECADLILRLWAHRADRPHGSPLAEIAAFLQAFTNAAPAGHQVPPSVSEGTWINAFHKIVQLEGREKEICRAAAIAELSLDNEREWLTEHRDELSEDEQSTIENLIRLQDRTCGEYFQLDDKRIPRFGTLPSTERTRMALELLQQLSAERLRLLKEMKNGDDLVYESTPCEGDAEAPEQSINSN